MSHDPFRTSVEESCIAAILEAHNLRLGGLAHRRIGICLPFVSAMQRHPCGGPIGCQAALIVRRRESEEVRGRVQASNDWFEKLSMAGLDVGSAVGYEE